MRQMKYEGGFQGRTNKLVDGCYSFWQGGAFPIIHMVLCQKGETIIIITIMEFVKCLPCCLKHCK